MGHHRVSQSVVKALLQDLGLCRMILERIQGNWALFWIGSCKEAGAILQLEVIVDLMWKAGGMK